MTSKLITVECEFFASSLTEIVLPTGYTKDDIADYYVKWLTLYMTFKDGKEYEFSIDHPDVDTKRPMSVDICDVEDIEIEDTK